MEESTPQVNHSSSASKFLIPIAVIIIIIGIIAFATTNRKEEAVVSNKTEEINSTSDESTQAPTNPQSTTDTTSEFKNGTYSATGNYVSPGGSEEIGVTVTLVDGIITSAEAEKKATRPNTIRYQGMFVENFKPLVVGKKISEVELSRVSGSSLTSKGFNEALDKIKQQAKS